MVDNFDYKKYLKENKLFEEAPAFNKEPESDDGVEWVSADWSDFVGFVDELIPALKKLGLHVEEDPELEGSDMIGIIISKNEIDLENPIFWSRDEEAEELDESEDELTIHEKDKKFYSQLKTYVEKNIEDGDSNLDILNTVQQFLSYINPKDKSHIK